MASIVAHVHASLEIGFKTPMGGTISEVNEQIENVEFVIRDDNPTASIAN